MTRRDAINAYRLFLTRHPESEEAIATRIGSSWEGMLGGLLSSTEFEQVIRDPLLLGARLPTRVGWPVGQDLAGWITSRFAIEAAPTSRLADALAAVLRRLAEDQADADLARVWRYAADHLPTARTLSFEAGADAEDLRGADLIELSTERLHPSKRTVLLILHDIKTLAFPAAADLFAALAETHDVVIVLGGEAALHSIPDVGTAAVVGPLPADARADDAELARLVERLLGTYHPLYAFAWGVESRGLALGLHARRVPFIAVISQTVDDLPQGALRPFLNAADTLFFTSEAVAASCERACHEIQLQRHLVVNPETLGIATVARMLDELGQAASRRLEQARRDEALLMPTDAFDQRLAFGGQLDHLPRIDAIRIYLDQSRPIDFRGPPVWRTAVRRPIPGFHPLAYGRCAADFPADGSRHPLSHFLDAGRPVGPWAHPIIRITAARPAPPTTATLRAAIHGHFHYTDHIGDFTQALARNASPLDLFLTTTSDVAAQQLRAATADYLRGRVLVEVGENRGRDIAPFLRVLREHLLGHYDVVGHLHGKRSLESTAHDAAAGDRWRNFLWRQLLGPDSPVADLILERFAADPKLGLVFPENPVTMGWELNMKEAQALGLRLGLGPLPEHIEFPVGMMFWARPEALRPLADLTDKDFPSEPLPIDGTALHALERLLPLVAQAAGYGYAATYDPNVLR